MMLDYQFGRGTSAVLPRDGLDFFYSKRSDRLKLVNYQGELFATVRPNGAIALTLHSAAILMPSKEFLRNSVVIKDEVASFVRAGKSVFCKFVVKAGSHVLPGGEVLVLDEEGRLLAVGRARVPGPYMGEFNAGVAVKVRSARR